MGWELEDASLGKPEMVKLFQKAELGLSYALHYFYYLRNSKYLLGLIK